MSASSCTVRRTKRSSLAHTSQMFYQQYLISYYRRGNESIELHIHTAQSILRCDSLHTANMWHVAWRHANIGGFQWFALEPIAAGPTRLLFPRTSSTQFIRGLCLRLSPHSRWANIFTWAFNLTLERNKLKGKKLKPHVLQIRRSQKLVITIN